MIYNIVHGSSRSILAFMAGAIGIRWNWINIFNLIFVILLLVPNIIYALKCRGEENLCENRFMNALEQAGRYGSMLFMIIYLGKADGFGFHSVFSFLCYGLGSLILLLTYWVVWVLYFGRMGIPLFAKREPVAVFMAGRENVKRVIMHKWALVVLPSCLFLLCGITLGYAPLFLAAVCFAIGHGYVTRANILKSIHAKEEKNVF